jgi:hypothetical protein
MTSQDSYQPRFTPDGKENPKFVDLLEEDKPIANQKFVCVSFVSPENILKDKHAFFFEKFLKEWEFTKVLEKYRQFMHFLSYKYNLSFDALNSDLDEFALEEKENLKQTAIDDDFKTFVDNSEEALNAAFAKEHEFQTSVRSVKIRGVFPTQEEAELRCKMLRELDPNHNIYVGPVGMWMPWEPEAYKTGRVEYLEDELNQLMHEKAKNEKRDKEAFEKRVKDAKQKAIQENIKVAQESGNKLTQNIDKNGNLYDIRTETGEEGNMDTTSVADIKSELFDNPNIVPDTEKGEQPVRMHQQTMDSLTANANANSESNANEIVNEVIEEE